MYKLTETTSIQRLSDGWIIPADENNDLYKLYLQWIAEGNTPEPFDTRTDAEKLQEWRLTATCESAKLKYVLADSYAILDDIEAVISQQDGKVRSMWIFTNWSRNNQALIGMVTQMSQAIPEVKAVVDGAGGVDAFMDAWFKAGIDLVV